VGALPFIVCSMTCAALHTCTIILFEKFRPMQRKTNTTREYVIKFIAHLVFYIILFDKFRPMQKKLIHVIKVVMHLVFGIILFEKLRPKQITLIFFCSLYKKVTH